MLLHKETKIQISFTLNSKSFVSWMHLLNLNESLTYDLLSSCSDEVQITMLLKRHLLVRLIDLIRFMWEEMHHVGTQLATRVARWSKRVIEVRRIKRRIKNILNRRKWRLFLIYWIIHYREFLCRFMYKLLLRGI